MRTAKTLRLPAGDVLTQWCGKPAQVYGAGSSGALECCCEHVGLSPVRGPSGRRRMLPREVVAVEVLYERVAGLDVGKATLTACVRTPGPRGRRGETRTFKTTVGSLRVMRDWLLANGVTFAAMESASTYWKAPLRRCWRSAGSPAR